MALQGWLPSSALDIDLGVAVAELLLELADPGLRLSLTVVVDLSKFLETLIGFRQSSFLLRDLRLKVTFECSEFDRGGC